jgi:hypothetical protein
MWLRNRKNLRLKRTSNYFADFVYCIIFYNFLFLRPQQSQDMFEENDEESMEVVEKTPGAGIVQSFN